jgi:phage protein D
MTQPAAYAAYPRLLITDQVDTDLSENLLSLLVEETWQGLSRCEITLNNFGAGGQRMDYLFFGRDQLDFGKDIALEVGPEATRIFSGRITGLEASYPAGGGAQITLLAEDRLQNLRMTRRTRSFEEMSDSDVISQIARDHSLTPEVDLSGPTHRVLAQVNLSDLAFVRECARRVNGEIWVDGTTLHAQTRTDRAGDPLALEYGVSLIAFQVCADLAQQCTSVIVGGWDVGAKSAISETAEAETISSELNGDSGGGAILDQTFGRRPQPLVHRVSLTSEEARNIAEARYRDRARRFVTGSGIADGNPAIRVGKQLDLSGLGPLFNGLYYPVRVRHSFDGLAGYRTEFEVERPGIGG